MSQVDTEHVYTREEIEALREQALGALLSGDVDELTRFSEEFEAAFASYVKSEGRKAHEADNEKAKAEGYWTGIEIPFKSMDGTEGMDLGVIYTRMADISANEEVEPLAASLAGLCRSVAQLALAQNKVLLSAGLTGEVDVDGFSFD